MTFVIFRYLLIFIFLWIPYVAHAAPFEILPEFYSLTEEEESKFESPYLITKEYPSDNLAYSTPSLWNYEWISQPRNLQINVGSLDSSHFNIQNRLKVYAPLQSWLEFRFTAFEDRSLEADQFHNILELISWIRPWMGISLYGDPDLYKRNDDTGLALLLKPSENHEIRIFNTFVDVTRLKRNDRDDTYLEPDVPNAQGIVGRLWQNPGHFWEYAIRYETKTEWMFPMAKYQYTYWKELASLNTRHPLSQDLSIHFQFQFDRKFESKIGTELSGIPFSFCKRDRWFFHAAAELDRLGPQNRWDLILGLDFQIRRWEMNSGTGIYRDWIPSVELRLPGMGSGPLQDQWSITVMASVHHTSGPQDIFIEDIQDSFLNAKLNIGYDFNLKESTTLRLIASLDLDQYGTRYSWDGGNGQLILRF